MSDEPQLQSLVDAPNLLGFHAAPAIDLELERLQRLATLGTLTSGIAHEFNNILTPVMAYAEMAAGDPTDSALVVRALAKVIDGIRRATGISEAILALATDAPHSEASASTSIESGVAAAVRSLADATDDVAVVVSVDIAPGLAAAIEPTVLHQVLVNLLINARQATQPNSGSIVIRGRRQSSTGNTAPSHIEIEVEDSGRGIAPNLLPRVFEPFVSCKVPTAGHQGDGRCGRARSYGLGLTICKQLIERAGGSITVRSTLGLGTCFTVRLPAAAAMAQARAA